MVTPPTSLPTASPLPTSLAASGGTDETSTSPGGSTTDPDALSAQAVRAIIGAYVADVVRDSVRDLHGRPASCFCALSIAVGFDGPTNAVAAPGRVAALDDAPDAAGGASARSGRSGDSTAVSVTGGGSAAASATSGSTGAVVPAGSLLARSMPTRAAAATERTTTVDVSRMTDALRSLVDGLGRQMARASGADTDAQVADLLGAVTSQAGGREAATVDVALWDGHGISDDSSDVRCSPYDDGSHVPSCAVAVAISARSGAHATVLPPTTGGPATAGREGGSATVGTPGMATAISVAVSGAAVSSAWTGDQGARAPHGVPLEELQGGPSLLGSNAAARSGSSGDSMAIALTVRGASATSSRSGDTGSALSAVSGGASSSTAGSGPSTASSGGTPGVGGEGSATVQTGDSGAAGAWSTGVAGAAGSAASGDTGDATAVGDRRRGGPRLVGSCPAGHGFRWRRRRHGRCRVCRRHDGRHRPQPLARHLRRQRHRQCGQRTDR